MRAWIKILLVILSAVPMWLTIVAVAQEVPSLEPVKESRVEAWQKYLNGELLKIQSKRVQVAEIISEAELPEDKFLGSVPRFDLSDVRPQGVTNFKVKFKDDQGRLMKVAQFRARLTVQEHVPVALRSLQRGEVISRQDFELQWVDMANAIRNPVREEYLPGSQVKRQINSGDVIEASYLQTRRLVQKGERVKVNVIATGLSVTTVGIAQEAGSIGETIRVLNLDSKKEIYATVTGDQVAEVRI